MASHQNVFAVRLAAAHSSDWLTCCNPFAACVCLDVYGDFSLLAKCLQRFSLFSGDADCRYVKNFVLVFRCRVAPLGFYRAHLNQVAVRSTPVHDDESFCAHLLGNSCFFRTRRTPVHVRENDFAPCVNAFVTVVTAGSQIEHFPFKAFRRSRIDVADRSCRDFIGFRAEDAETCLARIAHVHRKVVDSAFSDIFVQSFAYIFRCFFHFLGA